MTVALRIAVVLSVLFSWVVPVVAQSATPASLDRCNVVWTSPSKDASGAMPIGNGEVGLNVWVEESGDLLFYLARTDSWSECGRLLKLGRIRVSLSPNPFAGAKAFRQELVLRDGQIVITAGDATLRVFVDADAPVVYVTGESATPRTVTAKLENWRTAKRILKGEELESCWTMRGAPASVEVSESADVTVPSTLNTVEWYHRNTYSVVPWTLKHQGIESLVPLVHDPLLNRTFGGQMFGKGLVADGTAGLKSAKPTTQFALSVVAHTAQTASVADWHRDAAGIAAKADAADAARRTAEWWGRFWNRSWVAVGGGDPAQTSHLTQAYTLQRWMTACAGRGAYPIKFNGSIFTVDPKASGGPNCNADWRRWGDCYWWQNTRIPYFAMLARGDGDELASLFRLFRDARPLCKARAKLYYDADGVYFPETMTIFGGYSNCDYGWDRKGHKPSEVLCPWWQYAWQQGLELTALMLDYYEHTGDAKFLQDELIPTAHDVLSYYDTRFRRDAASKLVIRPTQAVETYWYDVVNDTPSLAGLHDVLGRLLAIDADRTPAGEREFWKRMQAATPALPVRTEGGKTSLLPAEKFNPKRDNCENPELYAIWPFQRFGVGHPELATGVETFRRRIEKASFGWQYDGQCAAILGMTDDVKRILLGKIGNANRHHRFPVMWGPNYDWLPDQDHGNNIMLTVQHALLTAAGGEIYVLPAWPKEWDVSFKLHAPRQTTVECVYRGGKLETLNVTPSTRRKDVRLPAWLSEPR
ncbi:MAG: DUF5703 domain-containing protein [Thermoguttaceae bacterium]